mmetsp:Transcript_37532/g.74508  ORF Transcript_37532/g.74508 Transcript_37532/m.74508 type:complete len:217 (-) Transcript_37532:676-1326(-)
MWLQGTSFPLVPRLRGGVGCGDDKGGNGVAATAAVPQVLPACWCCPNFKGAVITAKVALPRCVSIANQMRRCSSEIMFSMLSWRSQINACSAFRDASMFSSRCRRASTQLWWCRKASKLCVADSLTIASVELLWSFSCIVLFRLSSFSCICCRRSPTEACVLLRVTILSAKLFWRPSSLARSVTPVSCSRRIVARSCSVADCPSKIMQRICSSSHS